MKTTKRPITARSIKRWADRFSAVRSVDELSQITAIEPYKMELIAARPNYRIYEIPKNDGTMRLIEDPEANLKKCLRNVNRHLQCCYYLQRPHPVHGFSISARGDDERNIVSNARCHLGKPYLLNVDLEDFFHTIGKGRVTRIWKRHFPRQNKDLASLLTRLATFKGRLPMGSPASPVLSNFAMLELDAELQQVAKVSGITYSRYADDLTFSSQKEITGFDERMIRDAISHRGFLVNEEKVKRFTKEDQKMVTGIVVGAQELSLPEGYLEQLEAEIGRLRSVMMVEHRFRTGMSFRKLKLLKQELQGKINFAAMVLGYEDEKVDRMMALYEEALDPPDAYESTSWLDIPYNVID